MYSDYMIKKIERVKKLPYGSYFTTDNKEVLFNRRYQPMMAWDHNKNEPYEVTLKTWIENIDHNEYIYSDINHPLRYKWMMNRVENTLKEWQEREEQYMSERS